MASEDWPPPPDPLVSPSTMRRRHHASHDELPPSKSSLTCRSVGEVLRDVCTDFILVPVLIKLGRAPTKGQYMSSEIEKILRLRHVRVMSVIIYVIVILLIASGCCYYYASVYRPCTSKLFYQPGTDNCADTSYDWSNLCFWKSGQNVNDYKPACDMTAST